MAIIGSKRERYCPEQEGRELRSFTLIELLIVIDEGRRRPVLMPQD